VNSVGNFMENLQAESGDRKESSQGTMVRLMLLRYSKQQNEAAPQELGGLNQEEVERVRSLIGNLDKPSGTCSLAYSGAFPTSIGLNVSGETFANSWVMDLGATNQMTHSPNVFFHIFAMPK
jgi:hypothetical protein